MSTSIQKFCAFLPLALALTACDWPEEHDPDVCVGEPPTLSFPVAGEPVSIVELENGPAPELPPGAVATTVAIGDEEIFAYELAGDGPPIVLMHGLPDNTYLYNRLVPELAGRRVIAFDFIGWGRSSKPLPGVYEYSFAQQQAEIAAVFDAFELDEAVVVVHDSSGPPGIDFALAEPDRVARLVLLNTFYGQAEGALVPPKGVEIHSDPRLEAAERAVQLDGAAIESYYRFQMDEFIVAADDEAGFIDDLWSLYAEARPAFVALTNLLPLEVGSRSPAENATLASLAMPVDIVFGREDPYLNPAVAEHFAANIPGATLVLLDDAGHFVQVDAPAQVAAAILGD